MEYLGGRWRSIDDVEDCPTLLSLLAFPAPRSGAWYPARVRTSAVWPGDRALPAFIRRGRRRVRQRVRSLKKLVCVDEFLYFEYSIEFLVVQTIPFRQRTTG